MLWSVILVAWAVLGILLTCVTVFYAVLGLRLNPTPWNFPGYPPLFDLLIYPTALSSLIAGSVWFLGLRKPKPTVVRPSGSIAGTAAMCGFTVFAVCAAGILERHDARWAAVRNGIAGTAAQIAAVAGDKGHSAFERPAGSHSLAAAGQRER